MWQTRDSELKYENDWIRVIEDAVVRPDGTDGIYGVVEVKRPAVFVVAMTDADEVALITVNRHTTGPTIEIPAGGADVLPGESDATLLDAARRELREETGLSASEWTPLGEMSALKGVCRAQAHVFLARGLTRGDATGTAEEGIGDVRFVAWDDVMAMIRDGRLTDGETMAALLLAALRLGRL